MIVKAVIWVGYRSDAALGPVRRATSDIALAEHGDSGVFCQQ
jgi:hypothetical protein